jgi:nicotinate phosphoribosyltransferase
VPIGTMAHEYLQSFQALGVRLRDFQKAALEAGCRNTAATWASR